jgi:hypothetical protein
VRPSGGVCDGGARLRLVEAAILAVGLVVTESLDVDLYSSAFSGGLFFSLFVLVPLMVTTPVSLLMTARYALEYRRRCP